MSIADMANSPLTIEDRLAAQEVVHRFAHYSDYCDWDRLATLYTSDALTEMDGHAVRFRGGDEQVAHARKSAEVSGGKNRHYFFNMIVEGEGDTARVQYCFLNVFAGTEAMKARIICSGRQVDTLSRTAEGWKIAHRRVSFDQDLEINW